MAKKGAAKIAADPKPTAAGPGGGGPVTLSKALESIAKACESMAAVAIVTLQVRVLRVLCDAAEGDSEAAPTLGAIRGSFTHLAEASWVNVRVGDLQRLKAAVERKRTSNASGEPTAPPPENEAAAAAAA